jgi:hypothetical protein
MRSHRKKFQCWNRISKAENPSLIRKSAAEDWRGIFVDPEGADRSRYRDIGKIGDAPGGEKTRRADPIDFRIKLRAP